MLAEREFTRSLALNYLEIKQFGNWIQYGALRKFPNERKEVFVVMPSTALTKKIKGKVGGHKTLCIKKRSFLNLVCVFICFLE